MNYDYPKVELVGSQWFYWIDAWTGAKGPYDSMQAAQDAMTMELRGRYGW